MKSRLLLFSLVSALPLNAADYQWDVNGNAAGLGGAGTWNTANIFWDDTASGANDGTDTTTAYTFTTADKAIFGGTGGAVSVGNDVSLNKLSVDTSGYSFTGSRITFGGTGATLSANADFTIANPISGSFTKDGTGAVTITGLTTFNTVTVTDGTLTRQASGDNDSSASIVSGGTLILASTAANSTSNVTLNSGTVRLNGTNDVQIWNGGTVTLNGGGFEQNGKNETVGSLVLNGGSITGLGTLTSGSVIDARSGSSATILGGTSGLTKTTAATVILTAANTYTGTTTISGGTLLVGNGGSTGRLGAGALVNNGTLTYNLVGTNTVATLGSGGITGITGSGSTSITADTINFGASGGFTATTSGIQSYIATRNTTTYPKGMVFGTSGAYNFTTTGGASITMKGDIGASAPSTASVNLDTSSGNGAIDLDISVGRSNQFYNIGSITANAGTGVINWTGTYGAVRGSDSSQTTPITLTGAINMTANFQSQTLQTLTLNATGSSTVTGNLLGTINLVKGGSQNLTLSGANTYTGTTAVNAGTLLLSGSATLPSSAINVGGGALLDVSGLSSGNFTIASGKSLSAGRTTAFAEDLKGNLTVDAGTLRVAGTGATAGTLTQTGNLTLNNAFLNVDLANATTTGSGVNDLVEITGDLTLTGLSDISVNKLTASLTSGTYTLATCTGTLTGDAATNLILQGLPDTTRQSFALATTPNSIQLVVSGIAANLVWAGNHPTTPTVWDMGSTANWTGADGKFADGDLVLFDDTASSTTVNLDEFVQPASLTFNNSTAKPYTLTGVGSIEGVIGLVKNGNGIVTLATDNGFSGAVTINSGTISIDSVTNSGAFGRLGTGNLVNLGGAADTGTLVYTGGSTSFNRAITVGAGGGILQLDTPGSLFTQTGTVTLNGTLAKSGPGDLTISTPVSGAGGITVNAGALTLPVANTFTGNILVSGGELRTGTANNLRYLGPDSSGRSVTIASGATLTLNANDFLGNAASTPATGLIVSGTVASTGKFNVLGNLTLSGGSLVATGGFPSTIYQAFSLAGTVTVAGASASTISATGTFNGTHLGTNTGFIVADATGSAAPDLAISSPLLDRNGDLGGAGGITKTGDGTMLLTSINTFSGNTTVNGGTLELASGGALRFVVNNTTSNKISGSGAVTLNGAFNIETSAVTNTTGSWTLVDAATLTENFGTFTINGIGWTETANVWTRIDGLKVWTFTEATGVLTLAPGNTFSSWMAGFTFAPGADTTATGDADGDGISNLIENVFGTAPNAATTGINQVSSTPGMLVFKHPVNSSLASNVTYTYTWATDLSEWKASGESNTGGTAVSINAVTTGAEATVTATVTPSTAGKVFVRIQATVAP